LMGRRVVVTHYGKLAVANPRKFGRPVNGGQVKVAGQAFQEAINAKVKGDYQHVEDRNEVATDVGHLTRWMTAEFGATHTHTILRALGLVSAAMSVIDDDDIPKRESDYSSTPESSDDELEELLHPRRGSW
jgi:hypothetical protein